MSDPTLGLPSLDGSAAEPRARVALGRKLFFDERLSATAAVSCATCHDPSKAMSDGLARSLGVHDRRGTRNAPSLLNVRFNDSFFWDGRRASLEEQALDPFVNPVEHGLASAAELVQRLTADPEYVRAFHEAYGVASDRIEVAHVTRAIASFQRTLIAGGSAFDRYAYKGERSALTPAAVRGMQIFKGRGECASCHKIGEKYALFTDHGFHRLNVGSARIEERLPELTSRLVAARSKGESLDRLLMEEPALAALGRFAVTLKPADIGRFRTPSLRNVALTAPYMHDGSIATLEEAVDLEIYYRGAQRGYPLILTPQEREDLVTFLQALTSPYATAAR